MEDWDWWTREVADARRLERMLKRDRASRPKFTREKPRSRERSSSSSSLLCMKQKAGQQSFAFTNWGGKRRGAGRKPIGHRARVSHAKRPKLAARFPVLVTLKTVRRAPDAENRGRAC